MPSDELTSLILSTMSDGYTLHPLSAAVLPKAILKLSDNRGSTASGLCVAEKLLQEMPAAGQRLNSSEALAFLLLTLSTPENRPKVEGAQLWAAALCVAGH